MVQKCRFYNAVNKGTGISSPYTFGKQPVVASHCKVFQCTFCTVIVYTEMTIFQITPQIYFLISVHDTGDKGRRSDTSTDQGRFFFRTFHGPAFRAAVYISDLFFNLKLCRYKTQAFYGLFCSYIVFFSAFRTVTGFPFQFIGPGLNGLKIGKVFFLLFFFYVYKRMAGSLQKVLLFLHPHWLLPH